MSLRNPDCFVAGGIHTNPNAWERILLGHPLSEMIFDWIQNKVDIWKFGQPFKGVFKKIWYDSDFPPSKCFSNHPSCRQHSEFVSQEILKRLSTGALRVWGKVGVNDPPFLVLPLTVEPTKPRLCLDARYLNLWMRDSPFSLDKLADVPRYVYKDSFMTKSDDKSGYDHVCLQESSQTYVGLQWKGWWFVCATLPFGWKESPFIYHTIGLAASSYFRKLGIPCSLYIDDRLQGELFTSSGPWSTPLAYRTEMSRIRAARAALLVVLSVLVDLGYTIGISKSVFTPTTSIEYLGFIVDSKKQAFILPERKIVSWAQLREQILACKKHVDVKTLQRFQGKCISFSLAVPAAKLFIRSMSSAIGLASDSGQVKFNVALRDELEHWRFLDSWKDVLPWRQEKHLRLSISTDASGYGWGCVVHLPSGDQTFRDLWLPNERHLNISTKEMLAVVNAIKAVPIHIVDCRVDVQVDSQVVIDTVEGQGSRTSPELTAATKELFRVLSTRNLQLKFFHVPSSRNKADGPSRCLSSLDSMLSPKAWERVEHQFGGDSGHTFDLMALDSNVQRDRKGHPLPHFTPFPSPNSSGINLFCQDICARGLRLDNPYVFPPFGLVGPVLHFLYSSEKAFTIVVPEVFPLPYWWPGLMARTSEVQRLGVRGDVDAILRPSKTGYKPASCPYGLLACRVNRF